MSSRYRVLALMGMATLLLATAPVALAATSRSVKVEGTNWFWESQKRTTPSDTTGGAHCPPATVCPDPQLALPNPHETGGLPVQVIQGEDEKISAVLFDLSFLPPQGARIHSFTFSVIESPDGRDRGQFVGASGMKIQACLIQDIWSPSEDGADEMGDAPGYDCGSAVNGKRKPGADPVRWDFNILSLARSWGSDPGTANGVMLVGNKDCGTCQIVLKGPRRNDANTTTNEAQQNRNNIQAKISFTPNPEPVVASSGFNSFSSSSSGFGFGGFEDAAPATDFPATGTDPFAPPASGDMTTPLASPFGGTMAPQAFGDELPPGMPGYFWLLVPIALLSMAVVRHVVLEPLPGKRPDGVVALIRRQNAARLGRAASAHARSPLAPVTDLLSGAGSRLRRLFRKVISGGRSA